MFRAKSIFVKYMVTFMLIIVICFAVISFTITFIIRSYGTDVKTEYLSNVANSAAVYIENDFSDSYATFKDYLFDNGQGLKSVLELLAVNDDDMLIFVVDKNGQVIHYGGSRKVSITSESTSNGSGRFFISDAAHRKLAGGLHICETDDMDGFFKTDHVYYAIPLYNNGEYAGAVFAASGDTGIDGLVTTMNRTIIMAALWIMLASLVVIYFTTERFISPIREMSKAARAFANGQFDARVPVVGRDEVAELASAFNNMAASMQTLEDMRRTFLANVSHDLRTPMTTISGFIDGILDGAIPPEQHEYYLGIISSEVRRLSRLVRNMLDISRLQAQGVDESRKIRFDLSDVLGDVLIAFEQKINAKKLQVNVDLPDRALWTRAERDSITQVVYNLVDNAIKFCPEGGQLTLRLYPDGAKAHVAVQNTGPTIDPEELPLLFDRFHKADKSRSADREGWGLGLYIAKAIVGAHGGDIWATSQNGLTSFEFTIPAAH